MKTVEESSDLTWFGPETNAKKIYLAGGAPGFRGLKIVHFIWITSFKCKFILNLRILDDEFRNIFYRQILQVIDARLIVFFFPRLGFPRSHKSMFRGEFTLHRDAHMSSVTDLLSRESENGEANWWPVRVRVEKNGDDGSLSMLSELCYWRSGGKLYEERV